MFRSRLLTALEAIPLVLLVIFYFSDFYFSLAMLAVTGVGAWEWSRLNGFTNILQRILYVIVVFAGIYGAIFIPEVWLFAIAAITVLWSSVAVILYQMNKSPAGFQWPFVRVIAGVILLGGFCWASIFLKTFPFSLGGSWLLFYVMLLIWIKDTAGYFVGRAFGHHLMIPRVSPKKTWEGLAGSLFFGFLLAVLFSTFMMIINASYGEGYFSYKLVLISFMTVFFAVPGDLFISVLKRQVGVKDSGVIFPGHGGMLDRIDSLIAGAIIFVFGILFFWG
jgi:CDP-diglyceride synthetase